MAVTQLDWDLALRALLPPGKAFTREAGTVLSKLLSALAAGFLAFQLRVEALLTQADPRQAGDLLADWETMLGLPDACTPAGQTVPDRQRAAYQRLVEQGGASRAYFIGLAEQLGEPAVTITEFNRFTCNDDCNDAIYGRADLFTWRVNIPHAALDPRTMTCQSPCNAALQAYTPSVIECALKERKPAHTNPLFAYAA